jgi:deoxyribodipyrimidine photo-lyase
MPLPKVAIMWLRRDIRLTDNAALYYALKQGIAVLPLFIFDKNILDHLPTKDDRRVTFIHEAILQVQQQLVALGSTMYCHYGTPQQAFEYLLQHFEVHSVFTNHDYEPYALQRDESIQQLLASKGVAFNTYKDHVLLEKNEVLKDDGKAYTVFTPYSRKYKSKLSTYQIKSYPCEQYYGNFYTTSANEIISLQQMGFEYNNTYLPARKIPLATIAQYHNTRDIPSIDGTSMLGIHLRFGTLSIRQLAQVASPHEKYLNELIWRDFYQQILWHYPHVVGNSFRPAYDAIPWRNNEQEFAAWCNGNTGYPIVDAGMRQLNTSGWMHNRVRMIVASFLTKHLLIDWRWGEQYFANLLIDFELASNNGGWQWASGSGVDAAPYFRIFNPTSQTLKFDAQHAYIKKWVPEYEQLNYKPIVEHSFARERCLATYKKVLGKSAEDAS